MSYVVNKYFDALQSNTMPSSSPERQNHDFSIKSLVENTSTLLKSSDGTNFIYKITLPKNRDIDIKDFNKVGYEESVSNKQKENNISISIQKLLEIGATIDFQRIQSKTLSLNFSLIDSHLPEIMAYLLYYRYLYEQKKLIELVEILKSKNPLHYNTSFGHPFYEYKLKNLLAASALGMTPETVWEGKHDATKGFILAKSSGERLCYHIYNIDEFYNSLLNNTAIEQTAKSADKLKIEKDKKDKDLKPYKSGLVYEESGELFIKLNLQIRFNKK